MFLDEIKIIRCEGGFLIEGWEPTDGTRRTVVADAIGAIHIVEHILELDANAEYVRGYIIGTGT